MSFDPEEYTGIAAKSVSKSLELAKLSGHIELAPIHLATVLYGDEASLGAQLVGKISVTSAGTPVTLKEVQESLQRSLKRLPSQNPPPRDIGANNSFMRVLKAAQKIQQQQKDSHTAIDHLLVALYEDSDVSTALTSVGLTKRRVEEGVKLLRGNRKITNMNGK